MTNKEKKEALSWLYDGFLTAVKNRDPITAEAYNRAGFYFCAQSYSGNARDDKVGRWCHVTRSIISKYYGVHNFERDINRVDYLIHRKMHNIFMRMMPMFDFCVDFDIIDV